MDGTVAGRRISRALVVNLPWEKQEKRAVTRMLKNIGCKEVVQIPNSPEGWKEVADRFCLQHDFTMILFHASGTEVDDMVERFLKRKVSSPDAFTKMDVPHDNCEGCPAYPEH